MQGILMKHLSLLAMVLVMSWAGACVAAEPSLCKSLCDADKRECRAQAHTLAADHAEGFLFDTPEKNPMARDAQAQVPAQASRALENAGTQSRRVGFAGACDAKYLRCTRACAAPVPASVIKPPSAQRDANARAGEE
jgi:hypothetical protein